MTSIRQVPAERIPGENAPSLPAGQLSVNELYYTIQGECRYTGLPTVFVRTSHCPLRCTWCDSKFTFYDGRPWTLDAILAKIQDYPTKHVCLTGGEPLSQPESFELCRRLSQRGYTVEVETSGWEDIAPFSAFQPLLRERVVVNLDVKCPGSAMSNFNRWTNLAHLRLHDQVKFILRDEEDYGFAKKILADRRIACSVYLHPVWGQLEPAAIADWVKRDGLPVHVGVQLHKLLWGDVRGV